MGTHERNLNRGNCLKPTAVALLGQPLDFIHEDHLRERQICTMIDAIAQDETTSETDIADVHAFLSAVPAARLVSTDPHSAKPRKAVLTIS